MSTQSLYAAFGVDPTAGDDGPLAALYGGDPERPRYNIAPTTDNPVVRVRPAPADLDGHRGPGRRDIELMHWGLVPSWAKDPSVGNRMFNARAESVTDKPAFRTALARRRCLIPASGYYEWQKIEGADGRKPSRQPFYITPADGSVMAFAGLWEYWKPAGGVQPPDAESEGAVDAGPAAQGAIISYTILTTEAVGAMAAIHDRMPLVLPASDWDSWLDESLGAQSVQALLAPPSAELVAGLKVRPVDRRVGSVANDDADLLGAVRVPAAAGSPVGADDAQPALPLG